MLTSYKALGDKHFSHEKHKICNNSARKKHFQIIFFIEKTNIMSYFMAAFKHFAKLATEKVSSNLRNIIIDQKNSLEE